MSETKKGKIFTYILIIATAVIAVGVIGYFRAENFTGPQIKAVPPRYNFGQIDPEPVSKEFELSNTGGSRLKISRVSTSCSCTTAEVTKKVIAPGNSTTLTVTFDPTAMDPPISGEVMRIVYVETNDPNQEEKKIKITATVSGGE